MTVRFTQPRLISRALPDALNFFNAGECRC